jgi:hypothetical protein
MSPRQAPFETGSLFQVVARRATGERVTISEHVDLSGAKRILSLIKATGRCREIFIERDGKRLSCHRDA